jgi:hypothetical protein
MRRQALALAKWAVKEDHRPGARARGEVEVQLTDITGVFSRFFVVGFYAPVFFALVAVDIVIGKGDDLRKDILFVGGIALVVALLANGLRHVIWAAFAGFRLPQQLGTSKSKGLDGKFLRTQFYEATVAYRDYVKGRWGLNTWVAWTFIEAELTERERELHADALGNVHFFLNACLGAVAVAITSLVVGFSDRSGGVFTKLWAYLVAAGVCLVLAYLLYLASVLAVRSWGEVKIVSAITHRGDVYGRLGLRSPKDVVDERDTVALAANDMLEAKPITCAETELRIPVTVPRGDGGPPV